MLQCPHLVGGGRESYRSKTSSVRSYLLPRSLLISMNISSISIGIAFLAGLVSFLSPCMLPLVPIYLAQLVGRTLPVTAQAAGHGIRLGIFVHATLFVGGFTLVFVALGATASALGSVLSAYQLPL